MCSSQKNYVSDLTDEEMTIITGYLASTFHPIPTFLYFSLIHYILTNCMLADSLWRQSTQQQTVKRKDHKICNYRGTII